MSTTPGVTLPAGCTSTTGYSPITGQKCDSGVTVTLPEGCTSTAGYSPITGQKCDSGVTTPTTPGTGVTGAGMTVALASDSPNAALVTGQASAIIAKFVLTNNDSTEAKITRVDLQKIGIGADSTLANVYLFEGDTGISDAATISQGKVFFNDPNGIMTIPAGTSKVLTVASDIATDTVGQVIGVALSGLTVNVDLKSTLPIQGNTQSIAAANLATYQIGTASPSNGDIEPTNDVVVWQATFIPTNKVVLSKLALKQISSIQPNDVQNFRLYVSGKEVAQVNSLDANNMVTFLFNETIERQVTLQVKADIKGGSGRTIQMSLRNPADITAKDAEFNVNISRTTGTANFPFTAGALKVTEGSVIVKKSPSSPSSYVSLNASNQLLAKYEMEAYGEPVKIDTLSVKAVVGANKHLRNGRILIDGVQYGSLTTLTHDTAVPFTVNYVLQPGKVVTVEVYADIYSVGSVSVVANDSITITLVEGSSNGMAQTSYKSISVPSGDVPGNSLTVSEGSMTVAKKSSYPDQNAVFPQNNYKIGEYTVSGSSVEAIDIYEYTLEVTVNDTNGKTSVRNVYLNVNGVNTPIKTQSVVTVPSTGTKATGTYSFSTTNALAKNGTLEVKVYADINTTGTPGTASISTKLTATGTGAESGTTVTSNNNAAALGQTITYNAASISITRDASTPAAAIVAGGAGKEVRTVSYKFEAQNDSYIINELSFSITDATAVSDVKLMKGNTLLARMPGAGTVKFAGINHSIPANTSEVLDVVLVLSDIGTSAGQTGADLTTKLLNTGTDRVKVIPASTGVVESITISPEIAAGNSIRVYKSIPTIELASLPSSQLVAGTNVLQKFTISADAAGAIAWSQIKFDITKTATAKFNSIKIFDGGVEIAGSWIESADLSTADYGKGTDGAATSGTLTFVPTIEQQIPAGSSKTYEVKINSTGKTDAGEYIMSAISNKTTSPVASGIFAKYATLSPTYKYRTGTNVAVTASQDVRLNNVVKVEAAYTGSTHSISDPANNVRQAYGLTAADDNTKTLVVASDGSKGLAAFTGTLIEAGYTCAAYKVADGVAGANDVNVMATGGSMEDLKSIKCTKTGKQVIFNVTGKDVANASSTITLTVTDNGYLAGSTVDASDSDVGLALTGGDVTPVTGDSSFTWSDISAQSHSIATSDWATDYLVKKLTTDTQTLSGK